MTRDGEILSENEALRLQPASPHRSVMPDAPYPAKGMDSLIEFFVGGEEFGANSSNVWLYVLHGCVEV